MVRLTLPPPCYGSGRTYLASSGRGAIFKAITQQKLEIVRFNSALCPSVTLFDIPGLVAVRPPGLVK